MSYSPSDAEINNSIGSNLSGLKCGTLNMRSCNLTDATMKNCFDKFSWVMKKGYDILFLSELKFHNQSQLDRLHNFLGINDICQYFCAMNSTQRSRGTAILIKNSLSYQVHDIYKSGDENLIVLNVSINNVNIVLASIYAPCHN